MERGGERNRPGYKCSTSKIKNTYLSCCQVRILGEGWRDTAAAGVAQKSFKHCQCKCTANERALLLAGRLEEHFFYAVLRPTQS